jgi:arylsulfatase A-like enzyme/uncharacterized membrane protein YbhN (UPF0104 family)
MAKKAIIFLVKLLVTVGLFTLLFRPQTYGLRENFWGKDTEWEIAQVVEQTSQKGESESLTLDFRSPHLKNRIEITLPATNSGRTVSVERSNDGASWEPLVERVATATKDASAGEMAVDAIDFPANESQFLRLTLRPKPGQSEDAGITAIRGGFYERMTLGTLLEVIRNVETHHLAFWLAFALLVKLAGMLCGVLRWRLLLKGQGLSIPFWYMVQSWFVGRTIGIFLPGTIGLDGYRLYDSARYTGDAVKSTAVIAVEKLIGIVAMTLLVFLTFPLGLERLPFKIPMLVVCMTVFGTFVVVSFLLLLNPRVIQVVVAAVPTPKIVRDKFDKLGAAATAYSGNRKMLLLAVLLGVLVHVGTCFMYFGTMSAIRAENVTIFDIFFASPLMIWGTVLGPTVGGEGIREIVFVWCLAAKTGTAKAILIGHLGWWVGEVVPFLIGLPIYLLRRRPAKEEMQARLGQARQEAAAANQSIHLTPKEVSDYRNKLVNGALAGLLGGLIAGALIGLGEASWIARTFTSSTELAAFWWGALMYGLAFAGVGLGIAGGLMFLYLLKDRFLPAALTFGLSLGGCLGMGGVVLGFWRFKRDVLGQHNPSVQQLAAIGVAAAVVAILGTLIGAFVTSRFKKASRGKAVAAGALVYVALVLLGVGLSSFNATEPVAQERVFAPPVKATGPNLILVAADALRADYLPTFSDEAKAETPALAAFATDSLVFQHCFAQASWTKPSFATLFSGLYPEAHTATTKTSALPSDVTTFVEALEAGGYYTKGFANNPNITATFNFHQGYTDYVDLEPHRHLGATVSASKLTIYEVIRRLKRKVVVTNFYQPAEVVTKQALTWLDGQERPSDTPFFLFLHYMDPHDPFMDWENPGVGYARRNNSNPDKDTFLDKMRHAYCLDIEHMDKHLGALFDGLRQRGLYGDTLILFVADHGEEFYDHEGWWHGQTLYDELVHVPLIVKLPGNALAGTANTDLARHIDVAPTLLHFAGVAKPEAMTGMTLVDGAGVFTNNGITYTYAENDFEGNVLQAVRTPISKVITANEDNGRDLAPVEYYNLVEDPKEQKNLAGQNDAVEAELCGVLAQMQAAIKEGAAEPALAEDADALKEQLESLGYLGD